MNRSQLRWWIGVAALVAAAGTQSAGQAPAGAPPRPAGNQDLLVLSPKAKSAGWTGVHKPHTKLADVLARHKGEADWAETIVDDESLFAQWVSMGPGKKTPRRMNGDTREWWIVQSGTLRFTIEGREPLVATKGFMVQVPYRTLYQIENVGTEPALRFEVNVARARKLYPMDETPVPLPGFEYVKTRVTGGKGTLDAQNRPFVDFSKVVSGEERGGAFVTDDRSFANIIMGRYQPAAAGQQGPLPRGRRRVLADLPGHDPLQHRGAARVRSAGRRRRLRPAADVAPGEQRRQGRAALVPPGDERLPVSGAHVRAELMRIASSRLSDGLSLLSVVADRRLRLHRAAPHDGGELFGRSRSSSHASREGALHESSHVPQVGGRGISGGAAAALLRGGRPAAGEDHADSLLRGAERDAAADSAAAEQHGRHDRDRRQHHRHR